MRLHCGHHRRRRFHAVRPLPRSPRGARRQTPPSPRAANVTVGRVCGCESAERPEWSPERERGPRRSSVSIRSVGCSHCRRGRSGPPRRRRQSRNLGPTGQRTRGARPSAPARAPSRSSSKPRSASASRIGTSSAAAAVVAARRRGGMGSGAVHQWQCGSGRKNRPDLASGIHFFTPVAGRGRPRDQNVAVNWSLSVVILVYPPNPERNCQGSRGMNKIKRKRE